MHSKSRSIRYGTLRGGMLAPVWAWGYSNLNRTKRQNQALAVFARSFCWGKRTYVGRTNGIFISGDPSKSTISRVRYGFSLWQEEHRRVNTREFACDDSACSSPWMAFSWAPTTAGTGMGALQYRHTTPRKCWRSISRLISDLSVERMGFMT